MFPQIGEKIGWYQTNQHAICLSFFSRNREVFFGLFMEFEPLSKLPKQTYLFRTNRNQPKESFVDEVYTSKDAAQTSRCSKHKNTSTGATLAPVESHVHLYLYVHVQHKSTRPMHHRLTLKDKYICSTGHCRQTLSLCSTKALVDRYVQVQHRLL
jgi:hypothetical protein